MVIFICLNNCLFDFLLQLEQEIEIHVLSTVIKLSDGSLGKVFTRGPRNDAHVFVYNCHLCAIPNLTGERCLQTHIAGKKHQTKLAAPVIDAETFRAPLVKGPKGKYEFNFSLISFICGR